MIVGQLKRCLAGFLAVAIILSSSSVSYALEKVPTDGSTYGTNAAKIVADYYSLTDDQKTILGSAQIAGGESYEVSAPVIGEDDISYDFEEQTIYANHPEQEGWQAVSADVFVTEGGTDVVKASVELKSVEGSDWDVEGGFEIPEDLSSYAVSVNYEYSKEIAKDEQERILAIPVILADGIQNLENLLAVRSDLNEVKTQLENIVTNKDLLVAGTDLGEEYLANVQDAYDELYTKIPEGAKTLAQWIAAYDQEESKVEFLAKYASDVYAALNLTCAKLSDIYDKENLEKAYEGVNSSTNPLLQMAAPVLRSYIDGLEVLVGEAGMLTEVVASEWAILETSVFAGEYVADSDFEAAVDAILTKEGAFKDVDVEGDILAPVVSYAQSVDVNTCKVYVTVQVEVANTDKPNTGEVKEIKALDRYELKLAEGSPASNVKNEIEAAVNNADLSAWDQYDFDVEGVYSAEEIGLEGIDEEGWSLTSDLEYVLTYSPVTYSVEQDFIEGLPGEVVYGSKIVLPVAEKEEDCYDYTVKLPQAEVIDTEYYEQGAELTVKANMSITRKMGEPKEMISLWSILADEEAYGFSDDEKAILESTALNSPVVKIRFPGETEGKVTAEEDGTHWTTADTYNTGIAGMTWIPDEVKLYDADGKQVNNEPILFEGVGTLAAEDNVNYFAEWDGNALSYKNAAICYKLHLTKVSDGTGYRDVNFAELEAGVNIPYTLVKEVQEQNRILTGKDGVTARTIYENLKNTDGSCKLTLNVLGTLKANLKGAGVAAITAIQDQCFNSETEELLIFEYLRSCAATAVATEENPNPDWNLGSIYRNGYYADIRNEANKLKDYITDIAEDEGFDSFLTIAEENNLLSKEALDELRGYIKGDDNKASLAEQFEELAESINDPHEYLNVTDGELDSLLKSIIDTDASKLSRKSALNDIYAYHEETVAAPSTVVYTVVVKVDGKAAPESKYTVDLQDEISHIFSEEDFSEIKKMITAAENHLGLKNKEYYNVTSNLDEFEPNITVVSGANKITVSYVPKTFKVTLNGELLQSFQYGKNHEIMLPECMETDAAGSRPYYYQYKIDGTEVDVLNTEAGRGTPYTFTDLSVFKDADTLNISREKIEKKWVDVDSFIKTMNTALRDKGLDDLVKFAGVKSANANAKNDKYDSIVMKVNSTADVETSDVMEAVANAFNGLNYSYIGFKGSESADAIDFKYFDENKDMKLNPQGLVEMILTSGTSTTTFLAAIDENGNPTNNVPLNGGYVAVDGEKSNIALGGTVVESNILLGTDAAKSYSLPMYITLGGDDTGYLIQIRNLMSALTQYVSFALEDNKVNFVGAVPEDIYNIYLSFMILMDNNISLDSINDADLKTHLDEIVGLMEGVLSAKEYDWEVVVNTLKELGIDTKNIEGQKDIITKLVNGSKKLYRKYKGAGEADDPIFEKTGKNYVEFGVAYDAGAVLADVDGYELIESMLASTRLEIPFKFELVNIKEAYEAIVIDNGQSGLSKINYTDDLAATLAQADGFTYVVLLKDIENKGATTRVLDINNTTILNLNGYSVYADINAEDGNVKIVNSENATNSAVAVHGNISGNATLMAGYYFKNKIQDSMINSSYEATPEGGMVFVHNKYYTLEEDADGNLTVVLTTKFAEALQENVKEVALEIATDLLFRAYTNSSVAVVEGEELHGIYNLDFANLVTYIKNTSAAKDAVLDGIDENGITYFVNSLIAKFTDFDAIASALRTDLEVASYDVKTSNWYAKSYIDQDNKLALSVNSGEGINSVTKTVTLKFADKDEALAETFEELNRIVEIKPVFKFENIDYTSANGFELSGSVGADIVVDMLGEDGAASDYATTLAVLVAYGMPETTEEEKAAKAEFIKAIEYYDGNVYSGYLKDAFDAVTLGQFKAALEKAEKAESFESIIKELGLVGTDIANKSVRLEECYAPLMDAFNEVGKELNALTGDMVDSYFAGYSSKTFGDIKNADGDYDLEASKAAGNVWARIVIKLFATKAEDEEFIGSVEAFKETVSNLPTPEEGTLEEIKKEASNLTDKLVDALEEYEKLSDEQKELVKEEYKKLQDLILYYEETLGVWAADIASYYYRGSAIKPSPKVYFGAMRLEKDKDYTLSWKNNVNAAKATAQNAPTVIIKLKGNYSGTIYKYFRIIPINLYGDAEYRKKVQLTINNVTQAASTKKNYKKPVIKLRGETVDLSNFKFLNPKGAAYKNVGTYNMKITGNSTNFTGSCLVKVNVVSAYLKDVTVKKSIPAQNFVAGGVKPGSDTFKLTYKGVTLKEGVHFKISGYSDNTNAGTATVKLTGLGIDGLKKAGSKDLCFYGTLTLKFKINPVGTLKSISLYDNLKLYTGNAIKLDSTGDDRDYKVWATKNGSKVYLVENKHFKVSYKNNTEAGTATMTVTGINGYTGTLSKTFKIKAKALEEKMLTKGKDLTVNYTKGGTTPTSKIQLTYKGKVLKNGTDYTLTWGNNKAVSKTKPYFIVKGKGNFTGSLKMNFAITEGIIASSMITVEDKAFENEKYNYRTSITVKDTNGKVLKADTDYKVYYSLAEVAESGSYKSFGNSKLYSVSNLKFNLDEKNPEIMLVAKIVGRGNYSGIVYDDFRMYLKDIAKATIEVKDYNYSRYTSELREKIENDMKVYYGSGKDRVVLTEGVDFDYEIVDIKNYQNAGEATVKITGVNTYGGMLSKTFKIKTINAVGVKLNLNMVADSTKNLTVDYIKNDSARPSTKDIKLTYEGVDLVYGRDYTVQFYNTKKVRTSTEKYAPLMMITGANNFNGTIKVKYTIQKSDIADLKTSAADKVYKDAKYNYTTKNSLTDTNGKALKSGTDYTTMYEIYENGKWIRASKSKLWDANKSKIVFGKNTKSVQMRVKFTGTGNYTGTVTDNFKLKR